jgi:hypothetical protein
MFFFPGYLFAGPIVPVRPGALFLAAYFNMRHEDDAPQEVGKKISYPLAMTNIAMV